MRDLRALLPVVLAMVGCGPVKESPPGELVASSKARVTTPAPDSDVAATVSGNNAFAIDVYRELTAGAPNVVFSPYSITTALGMTYGGAKTTTATAFESTLHISLPSDRFHRSMNGIDTALRSRGQTDGALRLSVENQLFAQKGFPFESTFLDLLATEYGAGVRLLDFATQTEAARGAINSWVKANTEGLIPELLGPGDLDSLTVLTEVNTVYFDARWMTKFSHDATRPASFELMDGSQKSVPTMSGEGVPGAHAVVDGTLVVELPYKGGELSMMLLVPPSGHLATFEASLSAAELERHVAALSSDTFAVQMPKFSFSGRVELRQLLTDLGLGIAFSGQADFSGMSPEPLVIGRVVHEAVIRTDEDGTVAAAATAVEMRGVSLPMYLKVDRPFLFVIRDRGTGSIVFMGRVADPG